MVIPVTTRTDLNKLATQVVLDRLRGHKAVGAPHGRARLVRMLPLTEAELAFEALLAEHRKPTTERPAVHVHPAVVALAPSSKKGRP